MRYVKITRKTAIKFFSQGLNVSMCPCNMRPEFGFTVNNSEGRTFEQYENEVIYYNCNTDTGKHLAYYA